MGRVMRTQVWLITGSSRGLGRAFTEEALNAGHRVVATARNSEHLIDIASKFRESVRTVSVDVTNEAQAKYAVDAALETFGGLDVLVNNAGYGNVSPVEDTSLADIRAQIETNLFGVIMSHHYSGPDWVFPSTDETAQSPTSEPRVILWDFLSFVQIHPSWRNLRADESGRASRRQAA
jgi:NAD(P)-dependent dehydrogenase (short-subunit alcohol dehydrogenase family)